MNAQELFLDVSSGRFLDGESAIPTSKPTIFSDEQKTIRLTTLKVRANTVTAVFPSKNSAYKMRLGTQALKLADGTSTTTAQANLVTAIGSVATQSSSQAIGNARIVTYSPVTATLVASVTTFPIVTAGFNSSVNFTASVTAQVSLGIGSITLPEATIAQPADLSGITDLIKPPMRGKVLSFTATLNAPDTATFAAVISGGSVTTIALVNSGIGYLNGTYPLSFSSPSPARATFTATISAGSVTTISIVTGGLGYGQGPFDLIFSSTTGTIAAATASSLNGSINSITITDGGSDYSSAPNVSLATPSAVGAIASVVASQDKIQSITLVNGGSGYAATPTVTMFTPAKRVVAVEPTNKISNVVGGSTFSWARGITTANVNLLFSSPDNLGTPSNVSVPSATISWQSGNTWRLQLLSQGYGYTTAPSVIHNDVLVYNSTIEYKPVNRDITISSLVSQSNNQSRYCISTIAGIALLPPTSDGILISSGGIFPEYLISDSLFAGNAGGNIFGLKVLQNYRNQQQLAPARLTRFVQLSSQEANARGLAFRTAQASSQVFPQRNAIFTLSVGDRRASAETLRGRYPADEFFPNTEPQNVVKLFDPQHDRFSDRQFTAVLVPETQEKPTRYAICRISVPPTSRDYSFLQNGAAVDSNNHESLWNTQLGGGVLETKIQFLDYGAGYTDAMTKGGLRLVEISSLLTQSDLIESPTERSITAVTSFDLGGFANNLFARPASVSTAPGQRGVKHFLSDGGFGYFKQSVVTISSAVVSGGVVSASITNQPANYIDGTYALSITTAPGLGTTAQVSLIVSAGNLTPVILNTGFGYVTAPIATAPAPNFLSGQLVGLTIATRPQGYSPDTSHQIILSESPVSGGSADAIFVINQSGEVAINITNSGFGYKTPPTAVGKTPDRISQNGFISSLQLSNQPEGYVIGRQYPISIGQSPATQGTANAILIRSDSSRYDITIVCGGFGYTSSPIVTAPAPDQPQGQINFVSVSTFGRGYSPGTYQCQVSNAPAGGQTGVINLVVENEKNAMFQIQNSGFGYTTAPLVSVPTPSGNILSSITITCAGAFYDQTTATFSILDATGQGAVLRTIISSGTINAVQVVSRGYGFTNNPAILFSSPALPESTPLRANQIEADFNITTASANAILSTATQRDILMEVYETDGTNEQVVAQATVSLAKRVLE